MASPVAKTKMRMLAIGKRQTDSMSACPQRGFSLIELLVTLFVIVLVTSLVTLNITSSGRDAELESQVADIAATAAYALDEAQFIGDDFGLVIAEHTQEGAPEFHYRWRQRTTVISDDDNISRWEAPTGGQDVFIAGQLPPEIELELELNEVAQDQELFAVNIEGAQPQLIFYASGETTPGALLFRSRESGELLWRLEWDLLGNFESLARGVLQQDELVP